MVILRACVFAVLAMFANVVIQSCRLMACAGGWDIYMGVIV